MSASEFDKIMAAYESGLLSAEDSAKRLQDTFWENQNIIAATTSAISYGNELSETQLKIYEQAVEENRSVLALMEEQNESAKILGEKLKEGFENLSIDDISAMVALLTEGITEMLTDLSATEAFTADVLEDAVSFAGNAARVAAGDVTAIIPALVDAMGLAVKIFDRVSNTFDSITESTDDILDNENATTEEKLAQLDVSIAQLEALAERTKREKKREEIEAQITEYRKEQVDLAKEEHELLLSKYDGWVSELDNRKRILENELAMTEDAERQEEIKQELLDLAQEEIDILTDKLSLASSYDERLELEAELSDAQLDLYELQNEELETQADLIKEINDLLSENIDLGLLDTENLYDQIRATTALSNIGLSGNDLALAVGDLGFTAGKTVNIGQIQTNITTNNLEDVTTDVVDAVTDAM